MLVIALFHQLLYVGFIVPMKNTKSNLYKRYSIKRGLDLAMAASGILVLFPVIVAVAVISRIKMGKACCLNKNGPNYMRIAFHLSNSGL